MPVEIVQFESLLEQPQDGSWLARALQFAIQLEFATIPPYLTAYWSIKDDADPAAAAVRSIVHEEMLHMALACNMLAAIGEVPQINTEAVVPQYPSRLPGNVKPDLVVPLQGFSQHAVRIFMEIEEPEKDIAHVPADGFEVRGFEPSFRRIGEFYDAIERAFHAVRPELSLDGQISGYLSPMVIESLEDVSEAIELIKDQGEGSAVTPNADGTGVLAHYYRFKEFDVGRKLEYEAATGKWTHSGPAVEFPEAWPVAPVPRGGYLEKEVTPDVWKLLQSFDRIYTELLDHLQEAWAGPSQGAFHNALERMFALRTPARALMATQIPDQNRTYAPCFRLAK